MEYLVACIFVIRWSIVMCKYVDQNGSAAKMSAGVAPEVNLRDPLQADEEACKWGDPHWLWNTWETSPEVQNSCISDTTKRTDVLQKIYEKLYCDFCVLAEPSWSSTRWYPLLGGRTGNDTSQLHHTSGGRSWVLLSPKIYDRNTTFAVSLSGRTTRFRWGIRSI